MESNRLQEIEKKIAVVEAKLDYIEKMLAELIEKTSTTKDIIKYFLIFVSLVIALIEAIRNIV